jgi:tetratricopeptide (TPR) repeat protein
VLNVIEPISPGRRVLVVATALAISAVLFHHQIASALVTRGDEFLVRANLARASIFYARALAFDPTSVLAADRMAFASYQLRTPEALLSSIRIVTTTLQAHPNEPYLLYDRGVCYRDLGLFHEAQSDFALAGVTTHDPRMLQLAGWAAFHAGNRNAARIYWRNALRLDPRFELARRALMRTRERR